MTLVKTREIIVPIGPSIAYVPLTQGYFSCIDEEDAIFVEGRNWFLGGTRGRRYAYRTDGRKTVLLHRVILSEKDLNTDHRSGDSLDNRKANLRTATVSQNGMNTKKWANNTSGYRGVIWDKYCKLWRAQIMAEGIPYFLGNYKDPREASQVYEQARVRLHGEFRSSR